MINMIYVDNEQELLDAVCTNRETYLNDGGDLDDWNYALIIDAIIYENDLFENKLHRSFTKNGEEYKVYYVNGYTIMMKHKY